MVKANQIQVDSTLVVGGSSYDGSISVRNASNAVLVTLNRSGITATAGKIGGWHNWVRHRFRLERLLSIQWEYSEQYEVATE